MAPIVLIISGLEEETIDEGEERKCAEVRECMLMDHSSIKS